MGVLSLIFGFLGGSVISPIMKYFTSSNMMTMEEFVALTGAQQAEYVAFVQATAATDSAKVSNNVSAISKLMILLFGLPAALHWSAVFLDSTFRFGWHIPALPGGYAGAEAQIALSFFILAPAMPIVTSIAALLGRK